MSAMFYPVEHTSSNKYSLECWCSDCNSYWGWFPDTKEGYERAKEATEKHVCPTRKESDDS